MKRFLGLLAFLLGVTGSVVCVAAIILTWDASYRYLGQVVETAQKVEELLASANDRVQRMENGVAETRTRIASLETAARAVAARGEQSNPADRAKVEALLEALSSKIERAEDTAETLRSAALLLRNGADLAATVSRDEEKIELLRSAETALNETVATLEQLRDKLSKARRGDDLQGTAQDVADLAGAALPALAKVAGSIGEVDRFLAQAEKEVATLRGRIEFWKTAGPALVTLILAWVALGQVSLLARGWSMLLARGTANG
jgi:chromosome segregation ATPase